MSLILLKEASQKTNDKNRNKKFGKSYRNLSVPNRPEDFHEQIVLTEKQPMH